MGAAEMGAVVVVGSIQVQEGEGVVVLVGGIEV
jgi:hypothetical protein